MKVVRTSKQPWADAINEGAYSGRRKALGGEKPARGSARGVVSLWDMLTMLSGATAVGAVMAVVQVEQKEGGGSTRLVVGVLLAIGLGFLSIFVARMAERLAPRTETEARLRLLYFAKAVWVFVAAPFLSAVIAKSIIHFALP